MSPKLLNILLVLIPVVLYLGYLSPMYTGDSGLIWTPEKSIAGLKSSNLHYAEALSQVGIVEREANSVSKEYSSIDPALIATTSKLLPDDIDSVKLRNEIIAIANKSGVAIPALTVVPEAHPSSPKLGSYKINFSIRSKYPAFKELMESYEKSTRLYVIENLIIKRATEQEIRENAQKENKINTIDMEETLNISITFRVSYLK